MHPIISVVGPTASGKTSLAIALALRYNAEILSADSMQFYRGMEIGTAAPTQREQNLVPHHFVSCLNPDESMAAGRYQALGRACLATLAKQDKHAVVVGGSGLYINALIDGLFEGPARDDHIRARLQHEAETQGNEALLVRLHSIDPDYAARLGSANDLVRIVRALEVYEITGTPYSELHRLHQKEGEVLEAQFFALNWDRDVLYERINSRVDAMISAGWVEEVRALIEAGHGAQLERLKALGFREIAAHLRDEQGLEEAIEATKMHHRRYAKRQLTWFRGDKRIHWLKCDEETPGVELLQACETILEHCK